MSDLDDFEELDALYKSGRKALFAAKPKSAAKQAPPVESANAKYLNPDNWTRKGGVALIHFETQSLLGNFSEYLHKDGTRKLVREDSPISVSATEVVEGSWWLGEGRKPEPKQAWHEMKMAILHLHLGELGLHSPAVEVNVHLSYGSIARCELAVETTFAQTEGTEMLVVFAAGTDVLQCMTRDCKVKLRMEVGA